MATETENKPVVAGEEEKKVDQQAAAATAATTAEAAAPAAGDKPAGGEAAAGGDTADKKPEEKPAGENAPAGGEGGDGATSSDATAATAPAKKEKEVKPTVHKVNFEKDVVYLYQFTRTPMLPSISPFCLKVETWLRLAGLKYEVSVRLRRVYGVGLGLPPFVKNNLA
uniref:GST N-terminal domain-containing protein n=1 Tax=Anopheles minimus TaxID=112268 RepID=A0A182W1M4_9DIPT